ncbi:MAG: glutaryl-CoA dehydrogenase, partial [Mycobacterium sp.]|nr:glutaryl-CoA dehydrogenase [Mycobacterium sp.]
MTTTPKPLSSFETRGAKDADPATASLVEDIGLARETDYFLMKDQLNDREKEIFAAVRAFGEAEILPIVNEYWERGEFPFDLIPKLAALNIVGDHNLGDHGCTSMSAVAAGLVTYELSRIDGSIATFFAVHLGLAMQS